MNDAVNEWKNYRWREWMIPHAAAHVGESLWWREGISDEENEREIERMNDTHAATHVGESLLRSLDSTLSNTDGESSRYVWTELYRDTDRLKHEQQNQLKRSGLRVASQLWLVQPELMREPTAGQWNTKCELPSK